MSLSILNLQLDLQEFRAYVANYDFGSEPANKLVIHHTWKPTKETWAGERTIQGLKNYYEGKGWPAGPHLFIAEDGIWLFSPMNKDGIHATTLNPRSIGIEVVGDYDREKWSGKTKDNALGAIKILMSRLAINQTAIFFHRDVSPKTCPGTAITKEWLFDELNRYHLLPGIPGRVTPTMQGFTSVSAPIPTPILSTIASSPPDELMIPVWAVEAVAWVKAHQLFEIKTSTDIRDAVKFYNFYQLIQKNAPNQ